MHELFIILDILTVGDLEVTPSTQSTDKPGPSGLHVSGATQNVQKLGI